MFERKQNGKQTSAQVRKRVVLVTVFVVTFGVVSAFEAFALRGNAARAVVAANVIKTERVLIRVEGMSCTSCASGIKAMLKRTPGVISAEVSFEKREADMEYNSEQTTREKIIEAITKLGYKASIKA